LWVEMVSHELFAQVSLQLKSSQFLPPE
jgi:hypothetical protein